MITLNYKHFVEAGADLVNQTKLLYMNDYEYDLMFAYQ